MDICAIRVFYAIFWLDISVAEIPFDFVGLLGFASIVFIFFGRKAVINEIS